MGSGWEHRSDVKDVKQIIVFSVLLELGHKKPPARQSILCLAILCLGTSAVEETSLLELRAHIFCTPWHGGLP